MQSLHVWWARANSWLAKAADHIHALSELQKLKLQEQRSQELRIEIAEIGQGVSPQPKVVAKPVPPKVLEWVLTLLANTVAREAALGDINERFDREVEPLGTRRAARKYWARAIRLMWEISRAPSRLNVFFRTSPSTHTPSSPGL
jgi:hypothetical protein